MLFFNTLQDFDRHPQKFDETLFLHHPKVDMSEKSRKYHMCHTYGIIYVKYMGHVCFVFTEKTNLLFCF